MPSSLAIFAATVNILPKAGSSLVVTSLAVGISVLGMIKIWEGACGLMSRNAVTKSSW